MVGNMKNKPVKTKVLNVGTTYIFNRDNSYMYVGKLIQKSSENESYFENNLYFEEVYELDRHEFESLLAGRRIDFSKKQKTIYCGYKGCIDEFYVYVADAIYGRSLATGEYGWFVPIKQPIDEKIQEAMELLQENGYKIIEE